MLKREIHNLQEYITRTTARSWAFLIEEEGNNLSNYNGETLLDLFEENLDYTASDIDKTCSYKQIIHIILERDIRQAYFGEISQEAKAKFIERWNSLDNATRNMVLAEVGEIVSQTLQKIDNAHRSIVYRNKEKDDD